MNNSPTKPESSASKAALGNCAPQSSNDGPIVNIAAYKFAELESLQPLRDKFKQLCKANELRGTILLSPEGINLFLAGSRGGIDAVVALVRSLSGFEDIEVKESYSQSQPFNRMLVKIKREIIAFGIEGIEPARHTSAKISAQQLKVWLDEGRPVRLLDTRNEYEIDLGTFRGAERLGIHHFRDFPRACEQLPESARHEPLVMFCTGGIRCEKAGPMMERLGFEQVYQLDGGILKYFEECGGSHYDGGCFVFDSRVVLGPDLQPTGAVQCFNCQSVLTHEDIQSPLYAFGHSCPNCYRTPDQHHQSHLQHRQQALLRIATSQPGSSPYDNYRRMHVPARLAGLTMIDFLCAFHPPTLREQWIRWIELAEITTSGRPVAAQELVQEGQRIDQLQRNYIEPAIATDIQLIFEDEALVIVSKPAPLPVHASGRYNRNTLQYILQQAYRPEKLRLAHRLDSETTGLVVFARKYSAAKVLQPQFAAGTVSKSYLLAVDGHPPSTQFECTAAIADHPQTAGSRRLDENGAAAKTMFQVLGQNANGQHILQAETASGRTHQVRLHALAMGLPIVGDTLYSEQNSINDLCIDIPPHDDRPSILHLHAWKMRFQHPYSGSWMNLEAARPTWSCLAQSTST